MTAHNPFAHNAHPDIMLFDMNSMGYAAMYTSVGNMKAGDMPTGAMHGLISSIFTRMKAHPNALPVGLWDRKAYWRHDLYPNYKANRTDTEEKRDIRNRYRQQTPHIQELLMAMGIPQVTCGNAEADDLGGVISRNIDPSWIVEMNTGDTDWWQGLTDNCYWFSNAHKRTLTLAGLTDPNTDMKTGHFVSADEYLQAKALAGDDSDDIDGVEKVGLATAVKYIRAHEGDIHNFWDKVDRGILDPKGIIEKRMATDETRQLFVRNSKLMDWRLAPPLQTDHLALTAGKPDWDTIRHITDEFRLKRIFENTKPALAQWTSGWRPALDAIDAALNPHICQPVIKQQPSAQ